MNEFYKKINKLWHDYAPDHFWGDPLDVRFYLCKKLAEIRNKKILDVGCGPGITTACLDKSNEIYAVDFNEKFTEIARKINPSAKIIRGDLFNLDFPEKFFDTIILAHVLPGDKSSLGKMPKAFIDAIKNFLKPGGKLFLTTPNMNNAHYKKLKWGEILDKSYLEKILADEFDYRICGWNPFPIQAGHILKYFPGTFKLLEWLMKKDFRKEKCVAFYVEAIKK